MKSHSGEDFLIGRGAPFFDLQRQMRLLSRRQLNSGRRAVLCISLTAVAPLVLGLLFGGAQGVQRMLFSPEFMTRFVLFVAICFLMERSVEVRLQGFLRRFEDSGLLDENERAHGASAVSRAIALRNSWLAEAVCVLLAVLPSVLIVLMQPTETEIGLLSRLRENGQSITAAGWWIIVVSNPVYWFLVYRWFWRIIVWCVLLYWISRLDLRLVATHPDGVGGIAFIGAYPNSFAPLVFGLSSVVAAGLFSQLATEGLDVSAYGRDMTAWLVIVLSIFTLPLLSFRGPLGRLKEQTLREADILGTRFHRAAERKLFARNLAADSSEEPSATDTPDPAAFRKAASALRTVPFSRAALVPLSVAALVPLLAAGATQLPFGDLLRAAKGLILL